MRNTILRILLFSLLPIMLSGQSAKEFYSSGLIKYNAGRYQEAVTDFGKAIKKDASLYDAYIMKGSCYEKLNQLKKALKEYSKVIKLNPDYVHAYVKRAQVYKKQGETDKAIADFSEALKLKKSGFVFIYRAGCYLKKADYEKALADYRKAEKILPNNIKAKTGVAEVYFLRKQYDNSLAKLDSLLNEQPETTTALVGHGSILPPAKRKKAVTTCKKLIIWEMARLKN